MRRPRRALKGCARLDLLGYRRIFEDESIFSQTAAWLGERCGSQQYRTETRFIATPYGPEMQAPHYRYRIRLRFAIERLFLPGAENLVGHVGGGTHFAHVVDADDVRARQDGGGDSAGGGEFGLLEIGMRQEALARGPHHDRQFERVQLAEMGNDRAVLFLTFAEAEARIDHHADLSTPARRARLTVASRSRATVPMGSAMGPSLAQVSGVPRM